MGDYEELDAMNMALNTVIYSVLMILLGVGSFFMAEAGHRSPTALIPSFAGVVFLGLGLATMAAPHLRKHLMHAAAALGLLCVVAGGGRAIGTLAKAGFDFSAVNGLAVGAQLIMAALSAGFVGLCVMSFIAARKAQKAAAM